MKDYTAEVFIKKYLGDKVLTAWQRCEDISVKADSLEQAVKTAEKEVQTKLNPAAVHIDKIFDSDNRELYHAAWDEDGHPLGAVLVSESVAA